jgi:pentatricopeptide repeat protein
VGDGPAAEQLLERMRRQWQLHQERVIQKDERRCGSLEMIGPIIETGNTGISVSSPNAASRAQAGLTRIHDPSSAASVRLDLRTLNLALLCWARSSQEDGPDRCLGVLQQMKDLYARGELESPPDAVSYTTVMNAYAKAGRPSNAEDLFEEMYKGFVHDGHAHLKPTLISLITLLHAWARADDVERAWVTFGYIRELNDLGFFRSVMQSTPYNIMIACMHTRLFLYSPRMAAYSGWTGPSG